MIDYARGANGQSNVATDRFYIYGSWTQIRYMLDRTDLDADGDGLTTFSEYFDAPYLGDSTGWVVRYVSNRDFFDQLIAELNRLYPNLPHPVRLIPVSEVMARLDAMIRAGQLAGLADHLTRPMPITVNGGQRPSNYDYYRVSREGITHRAGLLGTTLDATSGAYTGYLQRAGIYNVFADQVHMNAVPHNGDDDGTLGAYIGALTFYATLTGRSPVGLPTDPWERIDSNADAALIQMIQNTVWEVVSTVVPGDADGDGDVDLDDFVIFKHNFGMTEGADVSNGDFDGDGDVDLDDFVILKQNFGVSN